MARSNSRAGEKAGLFPAEEMDEVARGAARDRAKLEKAQVEAIWATPIDGGRGSVETPGGLFDRQAGLFED